MLEVLASENFMIGFIAGVSVMTVVLMIMMGDSDETAR